MDAPAYRMWTFRTSPFAGKARVAFAEKGVDVELIEIHPVRRPARLRELNVVNRVPVLELPDGTAIRESSVICEWLEDTHPEPPLWPADPTERAWARGWARYIDDAPVTAFFLGMRKMAFGLDEGDPEDAIERLHAKLARHWVNLEPVLGEREGPWLCGEQITFADLTATGLAVRVPEWTPHLAPDPATTPAVAAWLDALRARPSAAAIDQAGTELAAA